ncbi:hypothetical protein GF359_10105 [candidate division WOR-3 bacterium]|uniref:DUF5320 domain-containing protein n=1 Tax=candidate division WOR-3 bacterium TaxID=2052148 RepID=A0A9D5KAJ7_UNCW3|nr:hypothetical protein [candidate division WOR-3 bacterium]MBD3365553.1 hypothetical protein [candidate division WOR-3 bacterium]
MNKHSHGSCCTPSHGSVCGCFGGHGVRRFFTPQEKKEYLEHYIRQLKKELAAAEEHLKDM